MAIGFNGSGDYAKRTGSPAIRMAVEGDKVTMAGWIKVRDITPGQWSYGFLLEDADASSSNQAEIGVSETDAQEFFASPGHQHTWSTAPTEGVWYYFYITGSSISSSQITFKAGYYTAAGGSPVDSYTTPVGIDEWDIVRISIGGGSWDEWLNCCAAYVRVWTGYELTDEELRAERDSTSAVKTDGLWADWPLANNTDTDDDSANNRDLTFGGTITTEDGPLGGGGATVVTSIVNVTRVLTETVCVVDDC